MGYLLIRLQMRRHPPHHEGWSLSARLVVALCRRRHLPATADRSAPPPQSLMPISVAKTVSPQHDGAVCLLGELFAKRVSEMSEMWIAFALKSLDVKGTPGTIGSMGCVRFRACTWVFPSTQRTIVRLWWIQVDTSNVSDLSA
jgi:hypothetical protein